MILNVFIDRAWRHAGNSDEMSRLISLIFDDDRLRSSANSNSLAAGFNVSLSLSKTPHTDENQVADNLLQVAINRSTGFGALIWGVTMKSPRKGGIYDSVWISDNPQPPNFDPQLISDPGYPLFHDPHSALPLSQVRKALEEFCETGTGDRPECVNWIEGYFNGQRLDRDPIVNRLESAEDRSPF